MLLLNKGLYQIEEFNLEADSMQAKISLNKNHPIFDGHFPGQPVLPGVCMLQISQELIEKALDKKLLMYETGQVKFLKIIDPLQTESIDIQIQLNEHLKQMNIIWTDHKKASTLKYTASFSIQ